MAHIVIPSTLSALLSKTLVAFTIELDNEFEHRMSHRTTSGPASQSRRGPWLTSYAMWANFVRFVVDDPVPLRDLEGWARITNLAGLERWGYVVVERDPSDARVKPPRSEMVVRATPAGVRADEVWRTLPEEIERRWQARFGHDAVSALRAALQSIRGRIDGSLPWYLPVVGAEMFARSVALGHRGAAAADGTTGEGLDLPALLAQVLLAFTIEYERESDVSLPMFANFLRLLPGDREGVRLRDLPVLSGVSRQAVSMMEGFLVRRKYVTVERDPTNFRTKTARLTPSGESVRNRAAGLLGVIEGRWIARFGAEDLWYLRRALEVLADQPPGRPSPLFEGLVPYEDGWRASLRAPACLPEYPMVLHRGGYPDGS